MKVELVFKKNNLTLDSSEVQAKIRDMLSHYDFKTGHIEVESVTIMSRWMIALLNLPDIQMVYNPEGNWLSKYIPKITEYTLHAMAGAICIELMESAVRYCNFEIHGEGESLILKKNWRKIGEGGTVIPS